MLSEPGGLKFYGAGLAVLLIAKAPWAMRLEGDVDMTSLLASSNLFSKMRLQISRSSSFGSESI